MDADDQAPAPQHRGAASTSETRGGTGPQDDSRAAHPAGRGLHGIPMGPVAQRAALHFEHAAVRWLAAQRSRLVAWPQGDAERGAVLRALADVAQLVGLRLRRDQRPLNDDYAALLTMLVEISGRAESRELLREDEQALIPLVAVQGALRASWEGHPSLTRALEGVLDGRSVPGLAPAAPDQIALHFLLAQAGIDLPSPQVANLMALAVPADDAMALDLTRRERHALTRVVLTASDFSARDIQWPTGTTTAGMASALQEWLLLAMADEDAEMVGALLSALTCVDGSSGQLIRVARRWLHGWQESNGRVDGRSWLPGPTTSERAEGAAWAAAVHATTMTALDSLLLRTHGTAPAAAIGPVGPTVTPLPDRTPDLTESIMAAADWLDAVLPGNHVSGRLWTSEAWLALGDEDEARRQLLRLADDPEIAFEVLKQSGDRAVHLAALLVALEVSSPPLADLRDDVAALLTHPEAAKVLLASTTTRARPAEVDVDVDVTLTAPQEELRRRSATLCTTLLREGPMVGAMSDAGISQLLLLARSMRAAVAAGDVGWLSLALRGLHRLELVPERLTKDATVFLQSQQRPDGAIGPLPAGSCGPDDRQVRWTLQALSALVEEMPAAPLSDAA